MASQLPARSGRPPASARGARTREALVRAARAVFERDGFLDARIADIAAAAGVATGSFYTYFNSKEDAFAAVIDEVSEEMLHPRLRGFADRDDPLSVIEATNRSYLVGYRRNARLMALMEQVVQIDEDFRRTRLRRVRAFTDRNAEAIAQLQRRGLADPELDPQLAAEALSAMVGRVAYFRYVHGFNNASVDSLTRTLTRLWAGALGLTSGRAETPDRPLDHAVTAGFQPSKPRR